MPNGNGLIKNFDFSHQGALIAIRSWRVVTIIDHSTDPTSTALVQMLTKYTLYGLKYLPAVVE